MIEILLLFIMVMMGFKRDTSAHRRKFGKYLRGNIDEVLAVGTLAARTLVVAGFDESVEERTFVSSMVASWSLGDVTSGAGIGPLMVGVAHSDYTAAEIEEFVENLGSWSEGDLVSQEKAKRKIRVVGIFRLDAVGDSSMVLGNGRPIRTKLGWILTSGQNLDMWAYNLGSAAFATTDPQVHCQGHANLWPR